MPTSHETSTGAAKQSWSTSSLGGSWALAKKDNLISTVYKCERRSTNSRLSIHTSHEQWSQPTAPLRSPILGHKMFFGDTPSQLSRLRMQETIIMLPLCRVSAKALTDFSWGLRKHVRGRAHGILRLGAGVSRTDETDGTPAASVCGECCTGGSDSERRARDPVGRGCSDLGWLYWAGEGDCSSCGFDGRVDARD